MRVYPNLAARAKAMARAVSEISECYRKDAVVVRVAIIQKCGLICLTNC